MTRILVSNDSLVDFSDDRWRLVQFDPEAKPSLLVEVRSGQNFRYDDYFGATRALPPLGEVASGDIGEVVLGWSDEEAAWQLGMTLSQDLSFSRSSRWFEVLRFTPAAEEDAKLVGKALADVMAKPFVVSTAPLDEPQSMPLAGLPLDLGIWQLTADGSEDGAGARERRLRFTRDSAWIKGKMRLVAWYGVLAAVYSWVSLASLSSDLGLPIAGTLINTVLGAVVPVLDSLASSAAEPGMLTEIITGLSSAIVDPRLLAYLGLGVFVLLLLLIMRQLWLIQSEADTLLIDNEERSISAWRGDNLRWRIAADEAQSVYASELVKRRGKGITVYHGEINLQLRDGAFRSVVVEDDKRNDALLTGMDAAAEKERPAGVFPLPAANAATALQAAALHVASALGDLPVWYDRRIK